MSALLSEYLNACRTIYTSGAGTAETSYYPALSTLFNALGKGLKPKVTAIFNIASRGAGIPDAGFFTQEQLRGQVDAASLLGSTVPARGVMEVKGMAQDLDPLARSEQVGKYLAHYGLVLATNLRGFQLVGRGPAGGAVMLERLVLADTPQALLDLTPAQIKARAQPFEEYLQRVLRTAAPLSEPRDLAWFLASYARDAKARVEAHPTETLAGVKSALEEALGITFEGEKGAHFFTSTLIQTLFYGIFSAWVLWSKQPETGRPFEWRQAGWYLHVPFIKSLFESIATSTNLRELGVIEILDWTEATLARVDRGAFFKRFSGPGAVQYFYEPFLEAFDPQLRKDLGVWYTPPEIVDYMVERTDRALRQELGIARGLADERVTVLDPACGTGAYVVAVLKRIKQTLDEEGADALTRQELKKAALSRVFGFELLPAPYVVAHLQLGLTLQELGTPLQTETERAAVYLTNSLTGWEPPSSPKNYVVLNLFQELKREHDQADRVKQEAKILVIIGNPPYNAFGGTSTEEENVRTGEGLVDAYKRGLRERWGIKKYNLDDLYVRFFRLAERRITEARVPGEAAHGIVCYISNFSYLSEPSFVVMRQHLLQGFDKMWFDNLNGDSRETGKLTPDGLPDPSAFSTEMNREGIRKGTAIGLLVRKAEREPEKLVLYKSYWGVNKLEELTASLSLPDAGYEQVVPAESNRFRFRPGEGSSEYGRWPKVVELFRKPFFNGPVERRGQALIDIDKFPLIDRISKYFDADIPNEQIRALHPSLLMDGNRIVGIEARKKLLKEHNYSEVNLVRFPFKPFDVRHAYLANIRPLFSEPSPVLIRHSKIENNKYIISRETGDVSIEGFPISFQSTIPDYTMVSGNTRVGPLKLNQSADLFSEIQSNIKDEILNKYSLNEADDIHIFYHILAIGYAPNYIEENAEGLKQDWPRIPLPAQADALEASATLGRQVAALLDTEAPVEGVTAPPVLPKLRALGRISTTTPSAEPDLALTAGWGHGGGGKPVMPARGRTVERDFTEEELAALTLEEQTTLGTRCLDVYLNDTTYWSAVPLPIWEFYIGGYQVLKKWLSYREQKVLGRPLLPEEARYVGEVVRRLTCLVLLQPQLNANYHAVKADTYTWPAQNGEPR